MAFAQDMECILRGRHFRPEPSYDDTSVRASARHDPVPAERPCYSVDQEVPTQRVDSVGAIVGEGRLWYSRSKNCC